MASAADTFSLFTGHIDTPQKLGETIGSPPAKVVDKELFLEAQTEGLTVIYRSRQRASML